MDTIWERRRLKRETFEPDDMHTAREGGIRALARDTGSRTILRPLCYAPVWFVWTAGCSYLPAAYLVLLSCFCALPATARCLSYFGAGITLGTDV